MHITVEVDKYEVLDNFADDELIEELRLRCTRGYEGAFSKHGSVCIPVRSLGDVDRVTRILDAVGIAYTIFK